MGEQSHLPVEVVPEKLHSDRFLILTPIDVSLAKPGLKFTLGNVTRRILAV